MCQFSQSPKIQLFLAQVHTLLLGTHTLYIYFLMVWPTTMAALLPGPSPIQCFWDLSLLSVLYEIKNSLVTHSSTPWDLTGWPFLMVLFVFCLFYYFLNFIFLILFYFRLKGPYLVMLRAYSKWSFYFLFIYLIYPFLLLFYFRFWGHTWLCWELIPSDPFLKDYSWLCSEDYKKRCWGLNQGWLCARQALYLLYYHSIPSFKHPLCFNFFLLLLISFWDLESHPAMLSTYFLCYAQVSLLEELRKLYWVSETKPMSAVCKASNCDIFLVSNLMF